MIINVAASYWKYDKNEGDIGDISKIKAWIYDISGFHLFIYSYNSFQSF